MELGLDKSFLEESIGGPIAGIGAACCDIRAHNVILKVGVRRPYRGLLEFVEGPLGHGIVVLLACAPARACRPNMISPVSLQ